jgi:cytoskeletal protein CcmA (bactofilin family)
MFGRRNLDNQIVLPPQPTEGDLNLDVLADFSDVPDSPVSAAAPQPPPEELLAELERTYAAPAPPPPPANQLNQAASPPNNGSTSPTAALHTSTSLPTSADESVIGSDDFFDGIYRSTRSIRIEGVVRGTIESRHAIIIAPGAQVEADLLAEDIVIAGAFHGKIECHHRLEVASTGKIYGEITTFLLVVHEGGFLNSTIHMQENPIAVQNSIATTEDMRE